MKNQVILTLSIDEALNVWECIEARRNQLTIARYDSKKPEDILDPTIFEKLGQKVRQQL